MKNKLTFENPIDVNENAASKIIGATTAPVETAVKPSKAKQTVRVNFIITEQQYDDLQILRIVMGGVSMNEVIVRMAKSAVESNQEDYQEVKKLREKTKIVK